MTALSYTGIRLGHSSARVGSARVGSHVSPKNWPDVGVKSWADVDAHLKASFPDSEKSWLDSAADSASNAVPGSVRQALDNFAHPQKSAIIEASSAADALALHLAHISNNVQTSGAEVFGSFVLGGNYDLQEWHRTFYAYRRDSSGFPVLSGNENFPPVVFPVPAFIHSDDRDEPGTFEDAVSLVPGFPGVSFRDGLWRASQVGPASITMFAFANTEYMLHAFKLDLSAWYAKYTNHTLAVGAADLAALGPSLDALQTRLDGLDAQVGRLQGEALAIMTALGVGGVYSASWLSTLLATIEGELAALLSGDFAGAASGLFGKALGKAADGTAAETEIARINRLIGSPDGSLRDHIKSRLSVHLADSTEQTFGEFFARCFVGEGENRVNLLERLYVPGNDGKKHTVADALRGLMFTEPGTGKQLHTFLKFVGLQQSQLGE